LRTHSISLVVLAVLVMLVLVMAKETRALGTVI
jgi:hypothetical protein